MDEFDLDDMFDWCGDEIDRLQHVKNALATSGAKSKRNPAAVHSTGAAAMKKAATKMPMKMAKKAAKGAMVKGPMKKAAKKAVKRTMSEAGRKAIGDAVRLRHAMRRAGK